MVDRKGRVYPLSSDTKVIRTIFEIIARQSVALYADEIGLKLREPPKQNHTPDFTLMESDEDKFKIAIDVKTTYRTEGRKFSYTLGSDTSYIHPVSESKNITYPYSDDAEHWMIGFVYRRTVEKRIANPNIYSFDDLTDLQVPFKDVRVFVKEKWNIASDKAGSGNTANIGSIKGYLSDSLTGKASFHLSKNF